MAVEEGKSSLGGKAWVEYVHGISPSDDRASYGCKAHNLAPIQAMDLSQLSWNQRFRPTRSYLAYLIMFAEKRQTNSDFSLSFPDELDIRQDSHCTRGASV